MSTQLTEEAAPSAIPGELSIVRFFGGKEGVSFQFTRQDGAYIQVSAKALHDAIATGKPVEFWHREGPMFEDSLSVNNDRFDVV